MEDKSKEWQQIQKEATDTRDSKEAKKAGVESSDKSAAGRMQELFPDTSRERSRMSDSQNGVQDRSGMRVELGNSTKDDSRLQREPAAKESGMQQTSEALIRNEAPGTDISSKPRENSASSSEPDARQLKEQAFEFTQKTIDDARMRQDGKCAHSGEPLDDVQEEAHHVIPQQAGEAGNPDHAELKSIDNCVILNKDCHHRVHENGRYRDGAVAPPEYFPYSHAGAAAEHTDWVARMDALSNKVWKS